MISDAIHPIDVNHYLAQRAQNVILIVLVCFGADFDQASETISRDELVDKFFIVGEDLLEREERATEFSSARVVQFLDTGMDSRIRGKINKRWWESSPDRELGS